MRRIQAQVSLSPSGVTVKNTDTVAFPSVTLILNMKETGGDSGRAIAGDIPAGKTITVPYGEFTDNDAKRFNIYNTKIYTVVIKTPVEPANPSYKVFLCPSRICQPSE